LPLGATRLGAILGTHAARNRTQSDRSNRDRSQDSRAKFNDPAAQFSLERTFCDGAVAGSDAFIFSDAANGNCLTTNFRRITGSTPNRFRRSLD
jgi:hypothetical protein